MSESSKPINYIYNKLVENENDILGHIAYSVYKRQKIEEINNLRQKNKSSESEYVSDEDIAPFIKLSQSETQISFYKSKAEELANKFLENSMAIELEEEKKKLNAEFVRNHKSHGYCYGVSQGVIGSFVFLLIGYALLMITGSWDKLLAYLSKI